MMIHKFALVFTPKARSLSRLLRGVVCSTFFTCSLATAAAAQCYGVNLFNELSDTARREISVRTEAAPYSAGNFWRLTKGDKSITMMGTYHLDDPRHDQILAAAAPLIADSSALLVEAGPREERALLTAIRQDPSLMMITKGPTLLEQMPPDRWAKVAQAFEARNIPAAMGAKFRPWYASVVLGMPPCALINGKVQDGLDAQLITLAQDFDRFVLPLEPAKTLLGLFEQLTPEEELEMLETSLAMEDRSQDYTATLADMYFAGESRLIWELTRQLSYNQKAQSPAEIDREMAKMESLLMEARNKAWIPVIEGASARYPRPIVVAFGALHLSGEFGVLNLMQQNGWHLERIEL